MGQSWWLLVLLLSVDSKSIQSSQVCTTSGCTRAASMLLNAIDPAIDPCEDFYEFACGGYKMTHPLINDGTEASVIGNAKKRQMGIVQNYLAEAPFNPNASIADKRVAKLYQLCLNIDKDGIKPLVPYLANDFGLPFLTPNRVLGEKVDAFETGEMPFLYIMPITEDPPVYKLMANRFAVSEEALDKNSKYLVKLMTMLANDVYSTDINEEMAQRILTFIAFNERLNEAVTKDFELKLKGSTNTLRRQMTIAELENEYPVYPWKRIFMPNFLNIDVADLSFDFVTDDLFYLAELSDLLHTESAQSFYFDSVQNEKLRQLDLMFGAPYRQLHEQIFSVSQSLAEKCTTRIASSGSERWIDDFFLSHITKEKNLAPLKALAEDVHENYLEMLKSEKWISKEALQKVYQYIKEIKFSIGPKERWDSQKLDAFYQNFTPFDAPTFWDYQNVASSFQAKTEFQGWNDPAAIIVNAQNRGTEFQIYLGIIEEPMFAWDYPLEINYGSMGMIIGHEITHSIDPNIRGLKRNWLTKEDLKAFDRKVQCVVDQYGNVTVPLSHSNGTVSQDPHFTWGEDVSDLGGIRVAYKAYRKALARRDGKKSQKLPGLDQYNNDQIFFLGAAQLFCETASDENLLQDQYGDSHPISQIRPNEQLKDFEHFANAFKCPAGSPMNPKKKCRVWRRLNA
ncbi:unnamed protein product, partial [Mesorhabditis belari]|uniref:Uncharacterized protein n=1 Tax=Mesorhabditis belari TaxID=2138241 RepID=A0AAF3EUN9_9BILA